MSERHWMKGRRTVNEDETIYTDGHGYEYPKQSNINDILENIKENYPEHYVEKWRRKLWRR